MPIETQRLLLRPWRDADAPALYRYAKDPRVGPIAGWSPHTSEADSLSVIRTIFNAPETYAVTLKATGEIVGSAGIMRESAGSLCMAADEAEIGYWLGVPYWGQGLIPEAVRALLRRCFETLGCARVWCGYYDGNKKSRRVQEKCGFAYHHTTTNTPCPLGDLRTEHFSCLTKEEWLRRESARAQADRI